MADLMPRTSAALDPRALVDSPFFRSKLRVPSAPQHFVHRARLTDLMDDLATFPVMAVVAPAGAGKTTLAADWTRRTSRSSAWLTIDDADRDPAHLCSAIISSLETLAPGVSHRILGAVPGGDGPLGVIRALCDDLEQVDAATAVLVVDDLHRIDDSDPVRTTLIAFVEHKPDWLHLLLLSRRRLALPVDRLRASGRLADISFDALRFSQPEDLEMLAGLCPDSAPADLASAAEWSDGWAAALQLAALAVRSRAVPHAAGDGRRLAGPAGSERLIDSYLWHEVLEAERPELVDLLRSTAVVDRMNYGLAEALSKKANAGSLLREAEERGLFVTAFDSGGWYEVHSLVREVLMAELERHCPERLREQHARAAAWLESMGHHRAAIEHWLDADEPAEALRLLATVSMSPLDAGTDPAAVPRILERIPPAVSGANADSLARYAWCYLRIDAARFLDAVAAAEAALTMGSTPAERARVGLLRSACGWLTGDWRACVDRATDALQLFGDLAGDDAIGRFGWSLAVHGVALDEGWADDDPVISTCRAAVVHDMGRGLAHEGARVVGLALSGQPLEALRISAGVRRAVESADLRTLRTELDFADAVAAHELGDRDGAETALTLLAGRSAYPCPYVQVLATVELVEMRLSDADVAGARSLFEHARELAERDLDGPDGRARLARTGVLVALADHDLAAAERWSGQVHDPFWGPICDAWVHLAAGRLPDSQKSVRRAMPRCERHLVVHDLALARATADRKEALKSVEAAVERAAEHGMLRTVATYGAAVLDLVELAAWRAPGAWMDRLRCALVPGPTLASTGPGLVEQLTDRERDVVRLLPTRLTLREIASELFVSQNTLKFHLRVIYRKLGVNSRAEAVATAQRLRILARG